MKAGILYTDMIGQDVEFTIVCDREMIERIMGIMREAIVDAASHAQFDYLISLTNQYRQMQDETDDDHE